MYLLTSIKLAKILALKIALEESGRAGRVATKLLYEIEIPGSVL